MTVDGNLISSIHKGILVFAAIAKDDTTKDVESMASKVLRTKLWEDENGFKVSQLQRIAMAYFLAFICSLCRSGRETSKTLMQRYYAVFVLVSHSNRLHTHNA